MDDFRMLVDTADELVYDVLAEDADIDGRVVRGMFDHTFPQPQLGEHRTQLVQPRFVIQTKDLGEIGEGDRVDVLNKSFVVVDIESDGTQQTVLILRPFEEQEWPQGSPSTLTYRRSKS